MTAVATKRRPRHERDAKPQAPRAQAGELKCDEFLRAVLDNGVRYEQRCDARAHGGDERHHPGQWTELPFDPTAPF